MESLLFIILVWSGQFLGGLLGQDVLSLCKTVDSLNRNTWRLYINGFGFLIYVIHFLNITQSARSKMIFKLTAKLMWPHGIFRNRWYLCLKFGNPNILWKVINKGHDITIYQEDVLCIIMWSPPRELSKNQNNKKVKLLL